MKRTLVFLAVVSLVAFCFGTMAFAADVPHHWTVKAVPNTRHISPELAGPPAGLYPGWAFFAGSPLTSATGQNSDGSDLWPCFGGGATANVDCPTIGDPSQAFPDNGLVVGVPSYSWSLSACKDTSTATGVCGQTETWYEDDSGDSNDDLTYLITATQGGTTDFIVDSGTVDFGPNVYGGLATPGVNVIIYGDQGFGTMGQSGANNGNCSAAYNYPIPGYVSPTATPTGIVYPYIIPAGKTCVQPVASTSSTSGEVAFSATTEIGTPKYSKLTTGVDGVNGNPCTTTHPCAKVSYTKKYSVAQKFDIFLVTP